VLPVSIVRAVGCPSDGAYTLARIPIGTGRIDKIVFDKGIYAVLRVRPEIMPFGLIGG